MSIRGSGLLCTNSAVAQTAPLQWIGGRTLLSFVGTVAVTSTKLQMLGPDNSTWLDIATIAATGAQALDLASGQFRLNNVGGSQAGQYATLAAIDYGA